MTHSFKRRCPIAAVCLAAVVAVGCLLAFPSAGYAYSHSFTDVQGDEWYADAALSLADDGVFYPDEAGTFGPDGLVTRADLAVYLARVLHLPLSFSSTPFTDVTWDRWYTSYVGSMYQAGLISGTSATAFSPDMPVSRQQAATLLIRALSYYMDKNDQPALDALDLADSRVPDWLAGFRDREFIDQSHEASVANAYRLKIVEGAPDGWFYPLMTVTKAQLAVMLYRAFEQPLAARTVYPVEIAAQTGYPTQKRGSEGPLVLLLESRLSALHYPCGTVDTTYDSKTADAVMAFEKVERIHRDGVADAQVWEHLFTAAIPVPKLSAPGHRVEVDLTRQVLFIVDDGLVTEVVHVSTGKLGTPTGHGEIWLKQVGWQECSVGWMYYPSYFWPTFAIHGSSSVPPYPASHGCVRVPNWLAAHVWDEVPMGMSVDIYH